MSLSLSVLLFDNTFLSVQVGYSTTVSDIKLQVSKEQSFELTYEGNILNDGTKLIDYGVQEGDELVLAPSAKLLAKRRLDSRGIEVTEQNLLHFSGVVDSSTAEDLIAAGVALDFMDGASDFSPLMMAAHHGNYKLAEALLDNGASINAMNVYNETALSTAVCAESEELITLLLSRNANVDPQNQIFTPLLLSAGKGMISITSILLTHSSPNVNRRGINSKTPLILAVENGCAEVVELLLSAGADPSATDKDGYTAFSMAVVKARLHLAELLVGKTDINSTTIRGNTPLLLAVIGRSVELVNFVLKQYPDVNIQNASGQTALTVACANGLLGVAKAILSVGPNVNLRTKGGKTALTHAVSGNHLAIVKLLIDHGADLSVSTPVVGRSPLHLAVLRDNSPMVSLLLASSPEIVDLKDNSGRTPLVLAVMSGFVPLVRLLIDANANVDAQSENGNTPLIIACVRRRLLS